MVNKPYNIAITGCIGSGKTTVSNYLFNKGYKVIYIDNISRNLLNCNFVSEKIQEFIEEDIFINEELNLKLIGKYFDNHPVEEQIFEKWYQEFLGLKIKRIINKNKSHIIFYDIPLLHMKKIDKLFDFIWVINADPKICIKRVLKRNNYSISKIKLLIENSYFHYNNNNTIYLNNNDNLENLFFQINNTLSDITRC